KTTPKPVVKKTTPKPVVKTPPRAPATYLTSFTCRPLGGNKYYIQYTLNRPPASPVRFPAYTWTGDRAGMYLGTVGYNGAPYNVDYEFSAKC
ncbi:hypothetical protein, partial [Tessaracoccus sp.]